MSVHTLENALWQVCNVHTAAEQFQSERSKYLAQFPLSEVERQALENMDIHGLATLGVNQMLLMSTWNIIESPERIPQYLMSLAGENAGAHSRKDR